MRVLIVASDFHQGDGGGRMSSKIQIFELKGGGQVAVEVETAPGEQERIANAREQVVEETGKNFSDALEGVQKAAAEVLNGFADALEPNELELTFGLKFSAAAGVVLASAEAEATMSLKAKWVKSGAA